MKGNKQKAERTFVCLNGKLTESKNAKISAFDHGYLYGDGVFETMRACNSRVLMEKEHLDRMRKAAGKIGIRVSKKEVSGAIRKTLEKNGLHNAYVRVSASRGIGETGLASKCGTPTILVIAKPLSTDKKIYSTGISCSTFSQDYANPLNSKSTSFLNYVIARRSSKADEVILLNSSGEVREGSTSNVFIVKKGKVLTPPAKGIVDGITRAAVLKICRKEGIAFAERRITKKELLSADECFITNSLKGIVPVVRVDGRKIGGGKAGTTTRRLICAYGKLT